MCRFQYSPTRPPWLSKVPPQTDILVTHSPPVSSMEACLMRVSTRDVADMDIDRNITWIWILAVPIYCEKSGASSPGYMSLGIVTARTAKNPCILMICNSPTSVFSHAQDAVSSGISSPTHPGSTCLESSSMVFTAFCGSGS